MPYETGCMGLAELGRDVLGASVTRGMLAMCGPADKGGS